jgi:creatinine amidohydrolase/Fe(II)-dependent formamide hydrolase-like protein
MDLADQLGKRHFRWIFVVHGHGDPAHNRMLDDAGDYFHDSYGGVMLNVLGHVWAMPPRDFRTPAERESDGLPEHASMTETSVILALRPDIVAPDFRSAAPQAGHSMQELQRIAEADAWPGYFGAPALASPELGEKIYGLWIERAKELVLGVINGRPYANLPRYGTLYSDDPADAAAAIFNAEMEERHRAWLKKRAAAASLFQ